MFYFITIILHIACNVIYWACEGIREAYYYDRLPMESIYQNDRLIFNKQPNIKKYFVLQRTTFILLSSSIGYLLNNDYFYILGLLFLQPFLHLGFLYKFRNKLNPSIYQEKFLSNSSLTSTARLDIKSKYFFMNYFSPKTYYQLRKTPIIRIVFFMLGLFLILISFL